MLKKSLKLMLVGVSLLLVVSCANTNKLEIRGVIKNAPNITTVYLEQFLVGGVMDSCIVSDGKFKFEIEDFSNKLASLKIGSLSADILLLADKLDVLVDGDKIEIKGNSLNNQLVAMSDQLSKLGEWYYKSEEEFSKIEDKDAQRIKMESLMNEYNDKEQAIVGKYLENNKDNPLGYYAATIAFSKADLAQMDSIIKILGPQAEMFKPFLFFRENALNRDKSSVGGMFIDVSGVSPQGDSVKLSDFVGKGKYVIVDFWASWCSPCKEAIPSLKKLYMEYKDKGLDLVGIYVFDKQENYAAVAKQLEITWPQICDYSKEQSVAKAYGVEAIPQIILFAPDGTIIAKDLHGNQVREAVESLIK